MPCHVAQIRYFQPKHEKGVVTSVSRNENELTFVHFNSHLLCTGHGQNQSTHANLGILCENNFNHHALTSLVILPLVIGYQLTLP